MFFARMKNYFLLMLAMCIFSLACQVDIRQVPPIRYKIQPQDNINLLPVYLGKFDIYIAEYEIYHKAWKASFKNMLTKNNLSLKVLDISEESLQNLDNLVINIVFIPRYEESFSWLYSWPAIYPFYGYWPFQTRNGEYELEVQYTIYYKEKKILEETKKTKDKYSVIFYGFYRIEGIEQMIERVNREQMEECAKRIALFLKSLQ